MKSILFLTFLFPVSLFANDLCRSEAEASAIRAYIATHEGENAQTEASGFKGATTVDEEIQAFQVGPDLFLGYIVRVNLQQYGVIYQSQSCVEQVIFTLDKLAEEDEVLPFETCLSNASMELADYLDIQPELIFSKIRYNGMHILAGKFLYIQSDVNIEGVAERYVSVVQQSASCKLRGQFQVQ